MTILDALRHQWRRQVRSPTWGRSLAGGLILAAAAAYLTASIVGLGWFYPRIVAAVAPQVDPLRPLNEYLLVGVGLLVVGRFFLQRTPGSNVAPYRALPVPTARLARIAQSTAALSLFNLLPLLPLGAVWASTVVPAVAPVGAALWAGGVLLVLAATEFMNTLLRVAWDRNAGLVLGGAGGLAGLVALGQAAGVGILPAASAWLFGGLSGGHVGPFTVLLLVAAGMARAADRALRTHLYGVEEAGAGRQSSAPWSGPLRIGARAPGGAASIALLDGTLILRNKRPRQALLAQLPLLGVFAMQFFLTPAPAGRLGALLPVVYCFLLTGLLGLSYHGLGYAWHGTHFDGLLARSRSPLALVRGQYLSFVVLCVGQSALASLLALVRPPLLEPLGSMLLYHLGVTAPLLLVGGLWAREAVQLHEGAMFNYQGNTTAHVVGTGLGTLLLLGLPAGLTLWLGRGPALGLTAGMGALGLVTAPLWTHGVARLLRWQRHAMAAGFRSGA